MGEFIATDENDLWDFSVPLGECPGGCHVQCPWKYHRTDTDSNQMQLLLYLVCDYLLCTTFLAVPGKK